MKKEIIKLAFVLVAAATVGFGSYKTYDAIGVPQTESNMLLAENIEALSEGDTPDDWSDCPRSKYVRNAREAWVKQEVKAYGNGGGSYVIVKKLGVGVKVNVSFAVGVTLRVPECATSSGNCCLKSHLDKAPRI